MTTASTIDPNRFGRASPARRIVTGWCLLVVLLVAVSGGCRTPALSDVQHQAGSAAEQRLNTPCVTARVRQRQELQTTPDVLHLAQGELDEATMVRIALINNPGLAAEYADLGIARSALVRAARLPNPTVEASARFRGRNGDAGDIKVAQDIVDVALLPRYKEAAERSLEAARDRMTSRILGVAREARAALTEYRAALVLLERKQEMVDCREAAMDVARRMVEAGNATALDLAAYERPYHAAQLELEAMRVDAIGRREAVNVVLGLHDDTDWKPKPAGNSVSVRVDMSADDAVRTALSASLELSAQRSEVEALARQRGIARMKAYLPEIKVEVGSERDSEGEWAIGPALALTIPLFDRGQADVAAVDARTQASWSRYAQTAVAIASATRAALTRIEALQQSLEREEKEVVPLCREALQDTLLQYNGMLVGVFDLLRAKEREVEAHARLTEITREYRLAQIDLQHVLAGGEAMANPEASTGAAVQADRGGDAHR